MSIRPILLAIADRALREQVETTLRTHGFSPAVLPPGQPLPCRGTGVVWISDLPAEELATRCGPQAQGREESLLIRLAADRGSHDAFTVLVPPVSTSDLLIAVSRANRYRHLLDTLRPVGTPAGAPRDPHSATPASQAGAQGAMASRM